MAEHERVHMLVSGRVQGVGFRAFVMQQAALLGLNGWVRNLGWNQVEAVAEGPRPALEQFALRVAEGPRPSRVDDKQIEWLPATGEFAGFGVRGSH